MACVVQMDCALCDYEGVLTTDTTRRFATSPWLGQLTGVPVRAF